MLEPPPDVTDDAVLDVVRRHWAPDAEAAEHLPVGWGAHHWRIDVAGEPRLFATLDPDLPRHTHASLEAAYASAAALPLEWVWPCLPRREGGFTVALGGRTVSVTGWLEGERPTESVPELPDLLAALHAVAAARPGSHLAQRDRSRPPARGCATSSSRTGATRSGPPPASSWSSTSRRSAAGPASTRGCSHSPTPRPTSSRTASRTCATSGWRTGRPG